jgi:hypothetical protein
VAQVTLGSPAGPSWVQSMSCARQHAIQPYPLAHCPLSPRRVSNKAHGGPGPSSVGSLAPLQWHHFNATMGRQKGSDRSVLPHRSVTSTAWIGPSAESIGHLDRVDRSVDRKHRSPRPHGSVTGTAGNGQPDWAERSPWPEGAVSSTAGLGHLYPRGSFRSTAGSGRLDRRARLPGPEATVPRPKGTVTRTAWIGLGKPSLDTMKAPASSRHRTR